MKVAGVIAEFDPFHNGHAYFLRRVRELTSADFIIAVMSGDYTQRGNPAMAGKRWRTEAALINGADIVIELPVQYATASAELFAMGGVSVLEALGCVDVLCFGTEEQDLEMLREASDILCDETDELKERLGGYLKEGMSYPAARAKAVSDMLSSSGKPGSDRITDIMSGPNNILAVEYLKALGRLGSSMDTLNAKREAVDHDSVNTYGIYSSAGNIRGILKTTGSVDAVSAFLPENTVPLMREHFGVDIPVFADDLSTLVKYRLLMESRESLMQYADMSADLARRIMNKRNEYISLSQFTELIKTKNITYTRIARALLHMLLSVKKDDMKEYASSGYTGYARVLGFAERASALLDDMCKKASIPVITRTAEYRKKLDGPFRRMYEDDLRASDIYHCIVKDIYDTDITPDISAAAYMTEHGKVSCRLL
ncbi:MAG: nucleotidyltransferase family protein [Lachnospiraceae bacterium]|nr:nucleotidyltransferase family protein [Lachnospiraceae bacterium]